MRISKITFALSLAALVCISSAAITHADPITFTGTRDFPVGLPAIPNPGRCGGGPPILLTTHLGTGNSNLGMFSSTESHCINVVTGDVSNGQFTFDFGGGNTFFGTYAGTVQVPLPAPPGQNRAVVFTYTLTGGTGIFTGASGTLLGVGALTFTASGPSSHIEINTVPEPVTFLLLATGFAGIGRVVLKRRKSRE